MTLITLAVGYINEITTFLVQVIMTNKDNLYLYKYGFPSSRTTRVTRLKSLGTAELDNTYSRLDGLFWISLLRTNDSIAGRRQFVPVLYGCPQNGEYIAI